MIRIPMKSRLFAVALLSTAITGCGDDDAASRTTTTVAGASTTVAGATTSTTSARKATIDLRATGLGPIVFGTPAAAAVRDLTGALGEPDDDAAVLANMPDGLGGPQTTMRTLRWAKLAVSFIDWKGSPYRSDGTLHFVRWIAIGTAADVRGLATPEGVSVGTTAAGLRQAYGTSLVFRRDDCTDSWQVTFDRSNVGLVGRLDSNPESANARLVYLAAGLRSSC
jgi:hypothetical protein